MSDLKKGIEQLVSDELAGARRQKERLTVEIERLQAECAKLKDGTAKEIAQIKAQCDLECRVAITQAKAYLKESVEKLETATMREAESLTIEVQIKKLDEKSEGLKEAQKEAESLKIASLQKQKEAEMIIEQYNRKLEDLAKAKLKRK